MKSFQTMAIVPAAGEGRRMGPGTAKVWRSIGSVPVLALTLRALRQAPSIEAICLVVPPGEEERFWRLLHEHGLTVELIVAGGAERQESVYNGLKAAKDWPGWRVGPDCRLVAIHDAARPLIAAATIERAVAAAAEYGAVGVGVRVKDTIKEVAPEGEIVGTPPRERLWAIQTPQVFRLPLILAAHQAAVDAGFLGTDDCVIAERAGYTVRMVNGDYQNIKITTPEDIAVAEAFMGQKHSIRTGQGFDVHRLVPDRKLILGGVEIDYTLGLLGHSDADVLIHAVMDALLGAAGLGDIGIHFPDTDERYKGADSRRLLAEVARKVAAAGYRILNIDATIIAQRPKVAAFIPQMRQKIAADLGIAAETVNVKATTTEGLGFTGRGEGIAAMAVATVEQ
jgi:2-C-methyl-D-erythritol 4-phosphate cytidylyltransferase/2-C-methyl-D-erythritol 2,4-cyclodiphosphate synthase